MDLEHFMLIFLARLSNHDPNFCPPDDSEENVFDFCSTLISMLLTRVTSKVFNHGMMAMSRLVLLAWWRRRMFRLSKKRVPEARHWMTWVTRGWCARLLLFYDTINREHTCAPNSADVCRLSRFERASNLGSRMEQLRQARARKRGGPFQHKRPLLSMR